MTAAVQPEVGGGAGPVRAVARSWETVHLSVQGASHLRRGTVCQDDSDSGALDRGHWAYVVVADGHGSRPYFRSDRGAQFAVESLVELFRSVPTYAADSAARAMADWAADAPRRIVASWRAKVAEDLTRDPPSVPTQDPEHAGVRGFLDDVRENRGYGPLRDILNRLWNPGDRDKPDAGPEPWELRAYGTTLLGVLVGPECLFWVQMGDGAMIKIVGGEAVYLVPPPPEAMANQTPSLCDDDAVRRMRAGADPLTPGGVPSTLLLATDGVPNSYDTEAGFFKFCHDVVQYVTDPVDLRDRLARWLPEISRRGSGDDMSVAMAWATEEADAVAPEVPEMADDAATPQAGVPAVEPEGGDRDVPVAPDTESGQTKVLQSIEFLPSRGVPPAAARPDAAAEPADRPDS